MTVLSQTFFYLALIVVISPLSLLAIFAASMLFGYRLSETTQAKLTKITNITGLLVALVIPTIMMITGKNRIVVELGRWVAIDKEHFHFHLKLIFDQLSVPFLVLCFVLCAVVGTFAASYLHRDKGYSRFFFYYALFQLGMILSALAGTIETLFLGWELVGLSSAMLVANFQSRPAPVRNGLRIWSVYRISDAAFLIAALTMHHLTGVGDFELMTGTEPWPGGSTLVDSGSIIQIGLLLIFAAAGKSAMVPFSGWLPRAMEGPTPSSAIFYGALSVHLGVFLLLRINPILAASLTIQLMVIGLGLLTTVFGALTSRVQTDVKNGLAYASLTQVGLITIEIGLGLYYFALVHMIGHACLRTLQLLRAPSTLRDHQWLENAVGSHLSNSEMREARWAKPIHPRLYRFAMHRGNLDVFLDRICIRPFISLFQWFDRIEHRITNAIEGGESRISQNIHHSEDPSKGNR